MQGAQESSRVDPADAQAWQAVSISGVWDYLNDEVALARLPSGDPIVSGVPAGNRRWIIPENVRQKVCRYMK